MIMIFFRVEMNGWWIVYVIDVFDVNVIIVHLMMIWVADIKIYVSLIMTKDLIMLIFIDCEFFIK
jgi:hypothetical protein